MEQAFLEKIFKNYAHLKGKYIGCFCRDQMEGFSKAIKLDRSLSLHERTFMLINTGTISSNGEHWIGVVMNKKTTLCVYFDSFGRTFDWLENTLNKHFNFVHKTRHIVQSESVWTCGLHTLYFIIRMMDPIKNQTTRTMSTLVNMFGYIMTLGRETP